VSVLRRPENRIDEGWILSEVARLEAELPEAHVAVRFAEMIRRRA